MAYYDLERFATETYAGANEELLLMCIGRAGRRLIARWDALDSAGTGKGAGAAAGGRLSVSREGLTMLLPNGAHEGDAPLAPDAILDAAPRLRGEHDPALAERHHRDLEAALLNFGAASVVTWEQMLQAMQGFVDALAGPMRQIADTLTTPAMRRLLAEVEAGHRAARREAASLRWASLTPRERKDVLRRHRKRVGPS